MNTDRSRKIDASTLESFDWEGQMRFKCPDCPFDSYSVELVAKHWIDMHRQTSQEPSGPTLFDSEDKPVSKKVNVPSWVSDAFNKAF